MDEQLAQTLDNIVEPGIKWPFKKVLNGHLMISIDNFRYTGKIVIPERAKALPTKGRVVGIADDITDIKVGDKILYSQFAGYLLKFDDTPVLRCIGYNEVLAILHEDSPEIAAEGA
jgi:co-chaperonin GroES (HSP10)